MSGFFYIISYDTPSDRRRRKLHKVLKNYAVPVQKSVFETFLDGPRFDELIAKILPHIDPSIDSVRVYNMTRESQKQMKVWGYPGIIEELDHAYLQDPMQSIDIFPAEDLPGKPSSGIPESPGDPKETEI
jgi:CRISPR-associated protein Cas2